MFCLPGLLTLLSLYNVLFCFLGRFYLSSVLSDISTTILVLLWLPIASNIFFHHFTFSLYVSLNLKWVSCRQGIAESYFSFFIHSTILCLLMGEFNLFTFKVMIDREGILLLQCCFLLVLYKYTSVIFWVWFQTTIVKQILQ